jgi:hypothetical protein
MTQASELQGHRHASLKLSNGTNGQLIAARVPLECSAAGGVFIPSRARGLDTPDVKTRRN